MLQYLFSFFRERWYLFFFFLLLILFFSGRQLCLVIPASTVLVNSFNCRFFFSSHEFFLILGVEEDGNDETVETQYFGEDEDQDHTDEETGLLGCTSYTSVTYYANRKACCET